MAAQGRWDLPASQGVTHRSRSWGRPRPAWPSRSNGGRYNTMPDERVDVADYLDAIRIYMLSMVEIAQAPCLAP